MVFLSASKAISPLGFISCNSSASAAHSKSLGLPSSQLSIPFASPGPALVCVESSIKVIDLTSLPSSSFSKTLAGPCLASSNVSTEVTATFFSFFPSPRPRGSSSLPRSRADQSSLPPLVAVVDASAVLVG